MLKNPITFNVTPERRIEVFKEISDGSTPAPKFYFMVVVSIMIAVLGLLMNSPAVIIGAMLVAPLMTPIFGIAVSLVRGGPKLLGRALRAEVIGILICIGISFIFGLIPLAMEPTPEMISRSQPNLLDLLVAIFAGLAGAYAMVDERISPSLPGVAIATAIAPPLANCGLCFAMGEIVYGFGSFLLFLANFLSILIASAIVFAATGMGIDAKSLSRKDLVRRFGVATVSLLALTIVFTFSLVKLVHKRQIRQSINYELVQALAQIPGTYLNEFKWSSAPDGLHILALVRSPDVIDPAGVVEIQNRLSKVLKQDAHLIIRTSLVKDIAAIGSTGQVADVEAGTEGDHKRNVLPDELIPSDQKVFLAEQVLWEHFSRWPGFYVHNVTYNEHEGGDFILANVQNAYAFSNEEMAVAQAAMRERLKDPDVFLIISRMKPDIINARGPIIPEWHKYEDWTEEKEMRLAAIETAIREELSGVKDVFFRRCHPRVVKGQWKVLIETTGLRPLTPEEIEQIQSRVAWEYDQPLDVYAWFRYEAVVTPDGYTAFQDFIKAPMRYTKQQWEGRR
jgi:uncharacterized hydrophobic protein (TIGR00271 family)